MMLSSRKRITLSVLSLALTVGFSYAQEPAKSTEETKEVAAKRKSNAMLQEISDNSSHLTKLPPDYLYNRLQQREDSEEMSAAFDRLLVGYQPDAHRELIDVVEHDFVHSTETSSLDLLNPELSDHFQDFEWKVNDYPGGADGENEQLADIMVDALDIVSPERRANRSRTAVLKRSEVNDELWEYLLSQWEPVPGEGKWKLNRYAKDSYVLMRAAAEADGVDLTISSGHRDPERAKKNAERAGNSFAVASFSSHSLGLAIDFVLPNPDGGLFALGTSPMKDVVLLRTSPVHKWLHLHGYKYGWHPFQHEPWHWEFNPTGFRDTFFEDYEGEIPVREPELVY